MGSEGRGFVGPPPRLRRPRSLTGQGSSAKGLHWSIRLVPCRSERFDGRPLSGRARDHFRVIVALIWLPARPVVADGWGHPARVRWLGLRAPGEQRAIGWSTE
jgi:hypothetical protein